jgi:hypothetical protein
MHTNVQSLFREKSDVYLAKLKKKLSNFKSNHQACEIFLFKITETERDNKIRLSRMRFS